MHGHNVHKKLMYIYTVRDWLKTRIPTPLPWELDIIKLKMYIAQYDNL